MTEQEKKNIYNAIQNLYNMDATTWQEVLASLYNLVADIEGKFDIFEGKFGLLLPKEVLKVIKEMYEDGRLAEIINEEIFGELNTKVDNNKTELSTKVDTEIKKVNEQLADIEKKQEVFVEDFGAKGDGISDDTQAIQNAIDYAYDNDKLNVNLNEGNYKITKPLLVKTKKKVSDNWWDGRAIHLKGKGKANTRIFKEGNGVLTGIHSTVDSIDATLILFDAERDGVVNSGDRSTGIKLNDIFVENTSDNINSYAITGKGSNRMVWKDLNIKSKAKGVYFPIAFSNIFENIVIYAKEEALVIDNGTSNTFMFVYTPSCKNPYKIYSAYSTMISCGADSCTGTIYDAGGNGFTMVACGSESPKAQYVVKALNSMDVGLNITSLSLHRQIGDTANNLAIEDCAIFRLGSNIKVGHLSIVESQEIVGNSYIVSNDGAYSSSLTLDNINYYKNYTGGNTNPKLLYSKTKSKGDSSGKINIGGSSVNVRRNNFMPYIGSRDTAKNITTNNVDKAIYLDNETKFRDSKNNDLSYEVKYNIGDVLLLNNPKNMNALGYVVTDNSGGSGVVANCIFSEIPISINCSTANRPTQNLYTGLMVFDTTLFKPIWCKYPSTGVWVDAMGTQV